MFGSTVDIHHTGQELKKERKERAEGIERIKYVLRLEDEDEDEDLISNHPSAEHLSDERIA